MITRLKRKLISCTALFLTAWGLYYYFWGQHLYLVTAYCDCPICVNLKQHQDSHFASGKRVYWGGAAADRAVPFGSEIALMPHAPQDWLAVLALLNGKRDFVVEDRGGKITGKHIDLFFSDERGGHQAALEWGRRKMRIMLNGALAK